MSFVATGPVEHAGGWHFAQEGVRVSLRFLLDFSVLVDVCKVVQAAIEQFLDKRL